MTDKLQPDNDFTGRFPDKTLASFKFWLINTARVSAVLVQTVGYFSFGVDWLSGLIISISFNDQYQCFCVLIAWWCSVLSVVGHHSVFSVSTILCDVTSHSPSALNHLDLFAKVIIYMKWKYSGAENGNTEAKYLKILHKYSTCIVVSYTPSLVILHYD